MAADDNTYGSQPPAIHAAGAAGLDSAPAATPRQKRAAASPAARRPIEETAAERWARFSPIVTGNDYLDSLRGRDIALYLFGALVENPVDHPIIRPSMNALAATYDLAIAEPDLASAMSPFIGKRVNRFLHIVEGPDDLVMKNRMQRRLGQLTGTCFQRCAGLDTLSVLHGITYEIDRAHGTTYHDRFIEFLKHAQEHNIILGAGMTDPKGDRSKRPSEQPDPDLYLHVTRRTADGLYVTGAKAHMTRSAPGSVHGSAPEPPTASPR